MEEGLVNSDYIQKLGHPILEIRQRALSNIICKLSNRYTFDNEIARVRELLEKLLDWFFLEPCTNLDDVLGLLYHILKSKTGQLIIIHCGKSTILSKLEDIRTFIEPSHLKALDSIVELVTATTASKIEVPPLCGEVPLSYRSDCSDTRPLFGSTATTIRGYLEKDASLDHQFGNFNNETSGDSHFTHDSSSSTTSKSTATISSSSENMSNDNLKFYFKQLVLPWQALIETDRNVLISVEKSLLRPSQPAALYHTCEFFLNVLLHDFPAEVFLQRPNIIQALMNILRSNSSKKLISIILECLLDLAKALQIRINHHNDPNLQNLKIVLDSCTLSAFPSNQKNNGDFSFSFENPDDVRILKEKQMSITDFCFEKMRVIIKCLVRKEQCEPKFKFNAINLSILLLKEMSNLLFMVLSKRIWHDPNNPKVLKILKDVNEILALYGEALEYYRIESMSLENDSIVRVVYLCLLHLAADYLQNLIPISKARLIFPKNFKMAIVNSLLDVSLTKVYPEITKCLSVYVEHFNDPVDLDSLTKYRLVMKLCTSLRTAVRFFKDSNNLGSQECLTLAEAALPSLEFHRNVQFVQKFIEICSEKLYGLRNNVVVTEKGGDILVKLLAHRMAIIRYETYRLCHKIVLENVGVKAKSCGDRPVGCEIFFLLSSKVFREIIVFGLKNEKVSEFAKDIILCILKCNPLVSQDIWNYCVETVISVMSYLFCFADNSTNIGRTIIGLADPDTAQALNFPKIAMFKANVQLFFSKDSCIREEAFSRICWLMAGQENSKDLLPKMMTVFDKALANSCEIKKIVDINKMRHHDHFYQPSSLIQVIDLLKSPNVEPVIRRSALNQISVIMEDSLLHEVFFENDGINLMIDVMKSALTENNYKDYPDAVIPTVSILKNVVLYHSTTREELSCNEDVLYFTLRGLFLYFTDERMRVDCATLLFLLIFKECIRGTPSRGDVSLLKLLDDKAMLPFNTHFYGEISDSTEDSLYDNITSDQWCLSSLQIHWNAEIYGGFEKLLQTKDISTSEKLDIEFDDVLRLTNRDLKLLKSSCVEYCVKNILHIVENGTSYGAVTNAVTELTSYVVLYRISSQNARNSSKTLLELHWEKPFYRFLKTLPSSKEDVSLLKSVLKFLIVLTPLFKTKEKYWLKSLIKDSSNALLDILYTDSTTTDDIKAISQELVRVITLCVTHEHNYLDYYSSRKTDSPQHENWGHIIKLLTDNLKLSHAEHFYYLAYLDAQLSCLVHLTAISGWSKTRSIAYSKGVIPQLISTSCKLISAFHCGKGHSATVSVMGLSITKNVLLVLNNLLAEKQNKVRGWVSCFFEETAGSGELSTYVTLWFDRDVIVRAASIQLFSILVNTPEGAVKVIDELKLEKIKFWDILLEIIIDCKEAAIVRENAVNLLHNSIRSIYGSNSCSSFRVFITDLFKKHDLYDHLQLIFTSLVTLKPLNNNGFEYLSIDSNSSSSDMSDSVNVVTAGLFKSICKFLANIESLGPNCVAPELEEKGLVKLIFRALCKPRMDIKDTKEVVIYSDILEMDISVCRLLRTLSLCNNSILGTVLHTQDCLNVFFSLLDSKIYHTHFNQLVCLKNELWTEIFNLIAVLSGCDRENSELSVTLIGRTTIANTIYSVGTAKFFDALFESLSRVDIQDLQNSALVALTSLLKFDCDNAQNLDLLKNQNCLQNLLDTVRSPRSVILTVDDNKENSMLKNNSEKKNLHEEAYFGNVIKNTELNSDNVNVSFIENTDSAVMLGEELCKILLYLYDFATVESLLSKRPLIVAALSCTVCISLEANKYASKKGLVTVIIKELRETCIKLSLESVESLKRVQERKRICPILQNINNLIGLLTNFMLNNGKVKKMSNELNLSDVLHKLWVWFSFQSSYVTDVLRLIAVFTTNYGEACRSLCLTSPVAGSGPKKSTSTTSLLHVIIATVAKEIDQISKTHDLLTLELTLEILSNCLDNFECRNLLLKSNLFQSACKLHPSITRRQYPWEHVEALWLQFLHDFTTHPEGQSVVAKNNEILELSFSMASNSKVSNRQMAMSVLRNLAFYQPNRPRLLTSDDFLSILQTKLTTGSKKEKQTTIVIIWTLIANNQKAKLIFKSSHFDVKLENMLKQFHLLKETNDFLDQEDVERILIILDILR